MLCGKTDECSDNISNICIFTVNGKFCVDLVTVVNNFENCEGLETT
jgi:hypothetical protein